MKYTQHQIDVAVEATSAMCFILHVTGEVYCDAVLIAIQLSHDQNGVLSAEEKAYITSLMP